VGDASDALNGSPNGALQVPADFRWFTIELLLDDRSAICERWEISAFRFIVIGVNDFVVTIGNQSSGIIQVHKIVQLKQVRGVARSERVGWILSGISPCQSIESACNSGR